MIMMQISDDNHESFEKMLMLAHLSESGGDGDGDVDGQHQMVVMIMMNSEHSRSTMNPDKDW